MTPSIRYPTGIPLTRRGSRALAEPRGRFRLGHHQRLRGGAGPIVGTWSCYLSSALRERLIAWKGSAPFDPKALAEFAGALADLVKLWDGGIRPAGTVVTTPPQGAGAPGPYAAEALARRVAGVLGVPFVPMLRRTDVKRYHSPWDSRRQLPYAVEVPDPRPGMALIVDDLLTSGTTMRLALEALRGAGIPSHGFVYSGH